MYSVWHPMSSCKLFLFVIAFLSPKQVHFMRFLCLETDERRGWIFIDLFESSWNWMLAYLIFLVLLQECKTWYISHFSYIHLLLSLHSHNLLVWQTWWKLLQRTPAICIVRADRISIRLFLQSRALSDSAFLCRFKQT